MQQKVRLYVGIAYAYYIQVATIKFLIFIM